MSKKGSPLITVIGAIAVLSLLAIGFLSSSKEKVGISKLMSDEKKMEALAESATDLVLSFIKKNANNHDAADSGGKVEPVYYLLRAPLQAKNGTGSENFALDTSTANPIDNMKDIVGYTSILNDSIKSIGWENKVEIETKCELSHAESFTPQNSHYKTPNIDIAHLPAVGDSAKFYDDGTSCSEGSSDWQTSNWELRLKFPQGQPTVESYFFQIDLDVDVTVDDLELESSGGLLSDMRATLGQGAADNFLESHQSEINSLATSYAKNNVLTAADKHLEFKMTRSSESSVSLKVALNHPRGSVTLPRGSDGNLDLKQSLDDAHFFPDINPTNLQGLKNATVIGDSNYNFSNYLSTINERKSSVSSKLSAYNNGFNIDNSDFDNPYYVEKGGILRITTEVKFKKSENNIMTKTLVAEIPFKTSDVQPIAPEYSLFIANSRKVGDVTAAGGSPRELGTPIPMNDINGPNTSSNAQLPAGWFIVHNVPFEGDQPNFGMLDDGTRIPGMVRVNTDYSGSRSGEVTTIRNFIGTFEKPFLSELNKFFTPFREDFSTNKFNTRISFNWHGLDPKRYHEIEFPVLFEGIKVSEHIDEPGVTGFMKVFNQGNFDIVSVPTMLHGNAHMEHPLGLCVEGPIDSVYSRLRVTVRPDARVGVSVGTDVKLDTAKLDLTDLMGSGLEAVSGYDQNSFNIEEATDLTEIYYDYEPVSTYSNGQSPYPFDNSGNNRSSYDPAPYGMLNHPGYNVNGAWSSNSDYKYIPGNCYDTLQYAKKATKYYDNESEFKNDFNKDVEKGGFKGKNGLELNGVFYIKNGDVNLSNLTYHGNSLIVCKEGTITISGQLKQGDDKSTLGLIARSGNIEFKTNDIEAACFSNCAPVGKGGIKLHGNLVCNDYIRSKFTEAEVFYDNTLTTVTPFASLRKVGKFEPRRYIVAIGDNWSKFAYEKKQ